MDFPVFAHARFLAQGWADGPPRHDLGGSAFVPDDPLDGLPRELVSSDVAGLDMHAATAFREAVANNLGTTADAVLPTAGTTAANLAVIASCVKPGSRVVCERPYYAPLPHTAAGFGAELRFVERADDGALDAQEVADAIDARTDLVLLTSPNNPTGQAATGTDLLRIAQAAHEHGAVVLVDQVFRELTDHALASGHPALISTGGLNKCWGAPGLRAGWIHGDPRVIAPLEEIHRLLLLAPSSPGTRIGAHLLDHSTPRRAAFAKRTAAHATIYQAWCRDQDLPAVHGELVAFLAAPDSQALAKRLLKKGILTVPGDAFGRPGHLRIGLGSPTFEGALRALADAWPRA